MQSVRLWLGGVSEGGASGTLPGRAKPGLCLCGGLPRSPCTIWGRGGWMGARLAEEQPHRPRPPFTTSPRRPHPPATACRRPGRLLLFSLGRRAVSACRAATGGRQSAPSRWASPRRRRCGGLPAPRSSSSSPFCSWIYARASSARPASPPVRRRRRRPPFPSPSPCRRRRGWGEKKYSYSCCPTPLTSLTSGALRAKRTRATTRRSCW